MSNPYTTLIILEENPKINQVNDFFNDLKINDLLNTDKSINEQVREFFDKGKFNYVIKCKNKIEISKLLIWGDYIKEQKVLYFSIGVTQINENCVKNFAKSLNYFCKHFLINAGFLSTEIGIEDAGLIQLKKFAENGKSLNELFKFPKRFTNSHDIISKRATYSIIGPLVNNKNINEIKSTIIKLKPHYAKKRKAEDITVKKYNDCLLVNSCPEFFDPIPKRIINKLNKRLENESLNNYIKKSINNSFKFEFKFQGKAKQDINDLINKLNKEFNLSIKKLTPKVNLVSPFMMNMPNRKWILFDRLNSLSQSNKSIMSFRFNNFKISKRSGSIYTNFIPSNELALYKWRLSNNLGLESNLKSYNPKKKFYFQIKLCSNLSSKKIKLIESFCKKNYNPPHDYFISRIALLNNDKILREYDFFQRKMFKREKALDKELQKITIKLINNYEKNRPPIKNETIIEKIIKIIKK